MVDKCTLSLGLHKCLTVTNLKMTFSQVFLSQGSLINRIYTWGIKSLLLRLLLRQLSYRCIVISLPLGAYLNTRLLYIINTSEIRVYGWLTFRSVIKLLIFTLKSIVAVVSKLEIMSSEIQCLLSLLLSVFERLCQVMRHHRLFRWCQIL